MPTQTIDIESKVRAIVCRHLGVPEEKARLDASFTDDLGADSLDTVEMVLAFEDEFGFEIPESAMEKFKTMRDAVDYIAGRTR